MTLQLQECEITFSGRTEPIFYAGEQVNGTFKMVLAQRKRVKDLRIAVSGCGKCRFTETERRNSKDESVTYQGYEHFIQSDNSLLHGLPRVGDEYELEAGEHFFHFSFALDSTLPSSFQGSSGKVRYKIIISLGKSFSTNKTFTVYFTVISNINLNYSPHLNAPVSKEVNEKKLSFFINRGSIKIIIGLLKTGFVSGESIAIQCTIENDSAINISKMKYSLYMVQTYTATRPLLKQRLYYVKISEAVAEGIGKKQSRTDAPTLYIPGTTPSTFYQTHPVVDIQYNVKVKAVVSGMHQNVRVFIPVTIGTVPLQQLEAGKEFYPTGNITSTSAHYPLQPSAPLLEQGPSPPPYPSAPEENVPEAPSATVKLGFEGIMNKNKDYMATYPVQ